jgi:C1A family cysteine protease
MTESNEEQTAVPGLPRHRTGRFGWVPDHPDQRDVLYAAPLRRLGILPENVDLTEDMPEVYDQGDLGSCTANAIGAAFEFGLTRQELTDFRPSRLFIYYNERAMEGTVNSDSGAMIRDGIRSVARVGVCSEDEWPYDISQFRQRPSDDCYREASGNRVVAYQRVIRSLTQMQGCLAAGFPFVFGFTVYDSFESPQVDKTGVVPMPTLGEEVLGGHAVLAVGYDNAEQRFRFRNSWGSTWGQDGYGTMPYAYLATRSLSQDFWTIREVTENGESA